MFLNKKQKNIHHRAKARGVLFSGKDSDTDRLDWLEDNIDEALEIIQAEKDNPLHALRERIDRAREKQCS